MISIRCALCITLLASTASALGTTVLRAAGDQPAAGNAGEKPWEAEDDCRWWMDAEDGGHRAAISPSDDGLLLSISDLFFADWSDSEAHPVNLSFDGDPHTAIKGEGWVTHIAGRTDSMISIHLDGTAAGKLGGAARVTLSREGRSAFAMDMTGTPDQAALEACIPLPGSGHGDSES